MYISVLNNYYLFTDMIDYWVNTFEVLVIDLVSVLSMQVLSSAPLTARVTTDHY